MKAASKLYGLCLVGILWSLYVLYLICYDNLLLSPKDIYEVLLPAGLQILILCAYRKLCKQDYYNAINTTFVICAGLEILWHFNLNHAISRRIVINLFLLLPVLITAIGYFFNQIKSKVKISILKNFGVVYLSSLINFIITVFSFYVFHYWI